MERIRIVLIAKEYSERRREHTLFIMLAHKSKQCSWARRPAFKFTRYHFLVGLVVFLILRCMSYLYILENNPLSVTESESDVSQSHPTLCDPMDCNLPGSSIHGIFQARTLEWVAISFSRRSSRPRDWTRVSRIVGRHFIIWATS